MSDLTNWEKRKFEKLLGMPSGYVSDFTNSTFADFIADSTGLHIYDDRYNQGSGSKANRLRAFWHLEDNAVVGKLMSNMLDYCSEDARLKEESEQCRRIVARILQNGRPDQKAPSAPNPVGWTQSASPDITVINHTRSKELQQLRDCFFELAAEPDRNRAGLALERLLNRLFELFELQPRQPFRVTGEQIDGSFQLDNHIYLLESKWEKHPLPEEDLLVFRGKIEGKSTFTRGVFLALNDVSKPARDAITRGKAPSFFVMNGHDLVMILSGEIGLPEFLRKRVRLLAEEGAVCVPFSEV